MEGWDQLVGARVKPQECREERLRRDPGGGEEDWRAGRCRTSVWPEERTGEEALPAALLAGAEAGLEDEE